MNRSDLSKETLDDLDYLQYDRTEGNSSATATVENFAESPSASIYKAGNFAAELNLNMLTFIDKVIGARVHENLPPEADGKTQLQFKDNDEADDYVINAIVSNCPDYLLQNLIDELQRKLKRSQHVRR